MLLDYKTLVLSCLSCDAAARFLLTQVWFVSQLLDHLNPAIALPGQFSPGEDLAAPQDQAA